MDILWWGYLHDNGSVHVKRFFDQRDLAEARESDFVEAVTGPFKANSREDAMVIASNNLGEDDGH